MSAGVVFFGVYMAVVAASSVLAVRSFVKGDTHHGL